MNIKNSTIKASTWNFIADRQMSVPTLLMTVLAIGISIGFARFTQTADYAMTGSEPLYAADTQAVYVADASDVTKSQYTNEAIPERDNESYQNRQSGSVMKGPNAAAVQEEIEQQKTYSATPAAPVQNGVSNYGKNSPIPHVSNGALEK